MTNEEIMEILKAPRENHQEVMRRINIKSMPVNSEENYAFFSYSHNDAPKVSEIFKKLYENGYNIWLDAANLTHNNTGWDEEARDALMDPNCVVVVFFRSETSVLSVNVHEEIKEAVDKQGSNREQNLPFFPINVVDIWGKGENCDAYQKAIKDLRYGIGAGNYTKDEKTLIKSAESRLNQLYKVVATSANAIQGEVENITLEIMEEFDKYHVYKRPLAPVASTDERRGEEKQQSPAATAGAQPAAQKADVIPAPKLDPVYAADEVLTAEHLLTPTEPKYKIFTFGPALHIGFGIPVTVCYKGKSYEGKTHSGCKGRVDGMSKLFKESPELQAGVAVTARLSCSDHVLTVAVK